MDGGAGLAGSMTPDDAAHDPRGPEVVLVVDSGHVVRSASPSAATAFSVPADKLDDTPLFDLVYRGDRSRLNDALLRVQRDPSTPQSLAVRVLYDLPRAPWAELTVQPLHTGAADSIVVTMRPFLTARRRSPPRTPTVSATTRWCRTRPTSCSSPIPTASCASPTRPCCAPSGPGPTSCSPHRSSTSSTPTTTTRSLRPWSACSSTPTRSPGSRCGRGAPTAAIGGSRARSATCSTTPRSAASSATGATSPIAASPRPPCAPARSASGRSRRRRRAPSSSATSTATSPTPTTVGSRSPVANVGLDDTVWSVIHPDDAGALRDRWEAEASLEGFGIRFRVHRPDGSDRWVDARTTPLRAGERRRRGARRHLARRHRPGGGPS